MTEPAGPWNATVTVHLRDPDVADWLVRALGPEAHREVPRASARVQRAADGAVEVSMEARDAGALRAALNTYLGWIHLALATARAARSPPSSPG